MNFKNINMSNRFIVILIALVTVFASCEKEEKVVLNPTPTSIDYQYYQKEALLSNEWNSGEPVSRNSESSTFSIDSVWYNTNTASIDTLDINIDNLGIVSLATGNNLPIGNYVLGVAVITGELRVYNKKAIEFDVVEVEIPEIHLNNSVANHFLIELNSNGTIKTDTIKLPDFTVTVDRAELADIVMTRPGNRYYFDTEIDGANEYGIVKLVQPLLDGVLDTLYFSAVNVAGVSSESFVVVEAFIPKPNIIIELQGVTEPVPVLIDENGNSLYSTVQNVVVKYENITFEDLVIEPSDKVTLTKVIDDMSAEEYAVISTPNTYIQEIINVTINGATLAGDAVEQTIAIDLKLDDTPVDVREVYSLNTPSLTLGKLTGVLEADFNGMYSYYIKGLLEGQDIGDNVWVMEVSDDATNASPNPLPAVRYYAEKLNNKTGNQSEYALISPEVSIVDAREISINVGTYYDQFSTIVLDDTQKIEYKIVTEDQYNAFIAIPIENEVAREAAAASWQLLKSINASDEADYTKDLSGKTSKYWDSTITLKINDIEELPGDNIRIAVHIINSRETAKNKGKTGLDKLVVTGKYKI